MRLAIPIAVVALALIGVLDRVRAAPAPPAAAAVRGTFAFAPGTSAVDRQLVLRAVGDARPPARRLIDEIAGRTTISVEYTGAGALGITSGGARGYLVRVDLGRTYRTLGMRGVDRVVLHELGHVVDFALVPEALDRRLDAEIPKDYGCDPGQPTGACAPAPERFAETFARWATGDVGYDLWVGYKVEPPSVPLEQWGAPLTQLR
jgi:hypothetical protein